MRFQPNNRYHLAYGSTGKRIDVLRNCPLENSLVYTIVIVALNAINNVVYHCCRLYN